MAKPAATQKQDFKILNIAYKGYKDGSVDFYGEQIEKLTGYTKEDFNTKRVKWPDLMHKEDRAGARASFVQALKGDKTYMREYRITHKTGALTWLQEWSQIVCDENGEVEYVTGILVDITENKKDEFVRLKYEERTGKYLTFSLAREEYGISIVKVKEIIELMPITPIPQAPSFVKGVINLRGKVIPVIDLRIRFGMASVEHSDRSCIIVVDIAGAAGTRLVGVMVDSVSDVLYISGYDIEDPPAFISTFETDFLLGMAKTEKSLKIILDIDQVLSGMDLTRIAPDAG